MDWSRSRRRTTIKALLTVLITLTLLAPSAGQTGVFLPEDVVPRMAEASPGPEIETTDVTEELLRLTNQARSQRGLASLTLSPALARAASDHAGQMVELNYFSHSSPVPGQRTTRQRVRRYGKNPQKLSENIFECTGYELTQVAELALESFLGSPEHRANLLDPKATHLGLGVSRRGNRVLVSQVFASGL